LHSYRRSIPARARRQHDDRPDGGLDGQAADEQNTFRSTLHRRIPISSSLSDLADQETQRVFAGWVGLMSNFRQFDRATEFLRATPDDSSLRHVGNLPLIMRARFALLGDAVTSDAPGHEPVRIASCGVSVSR
jgi:hypothetical protein